MSVVPTTTLAYITIWPAGSARPQKLSNVNSVDGRSKSNAAIIPAGTGGAISVFASDSAQIILDIDGYFVPATTSSSLAFYPLPPCRVLDTRVSRGGPGPFSGGTSRPVAMLSSSCTAGVPST
ncbi:MAG: hypothetical protein JO307_09430, partial [Bryobacterales bacterium]|nr:hypothetical protein [Bryobacterales bacterium]